MTYFIASDFITSGASDAYSLVFIDTDGYTLNSGTMEFDGRTMTSGTGFYYVDKNRWLAGWGSGAVMGNAQPTIDNVPYFGICKWF